ncbi:MAG: HAMP domain-containing sensor histidine kinase [Ferruginibacter sp.]
MSKTLEQKNTRYLLIWSPIVLLLGSMLFFVMLNMHSHHMQENLLELKQQHVWKAFVAKPAPGALYITGEYTIEEDIPVSKDLLTGPRDTSLYYPETDENINFKILTKQYARNGKNYEVTTYVSSVEFFHLIIKVFATETLIFLLLMLAIAVINRKSSRLLWRPFYTTLKKTAGYDVVHNQSFKLEQETGITEFNQLNSELTNLIEKVNQAYSNQKEFVENASHEIQTPLAIIRSKLDLLINEPRLTERTASLLEDITAANDRLSQMNKSLLLLAKIDNNQFPEREKTDVSELVNKILTNYRQHYDDFPLLTKSIEPGNYITANPALIEILFGNLIKNAVVHNIHAGYISVHLRNNEFTIENSGSKIVEAPELLFERFRKGHADSKTTGLGLALVKQIAQLYKMKLQYYYEHEIHTIKIAFGDI